MSQFPAVRIDPDLQAVIPPLTPEEFAQLEANLLAEGCRDPLVTWNGILIDGHNRYAICTKHTLPFHTVERKFADRDAVMDWMDANQLGRRNLNPDQRHLLLGRIYNRLKKRHGGDRRSDVVSSGQNVHLEKTAEFVAKKHGVNERMVRRAGKKAEAIEKLKETAPEQAQAVIEGKKRFNEVRREIKRIAVKDAASLPTAKHRVLYVDPPWKYGDQLTEDYGGTKFHYPSMSIAELSALPVRDLCEPDAVLFLWVTSPLLFEAAPLISAWGFTYKTSFVWDKIKHNMGHYNSVRHELLLVCTRGSCTPDVPTLFDSVQSIERTEKHSEKPHEFRRIIETLYPHGKRIELFARSAHDGWAVWGNQA